MIRSAPLAPLVEAESGPPGDGRPAVAIEPAAPRVPPVDATSRTERVTIETVADLGAIEAIWRELEVEAAATAFQRYDWIAAWAAHGAAAAGERPLIVLGRIDGVPAFVWPFGLRRAGPATVAAWLGGSHLGYHGGLHTARARAALDPATVRRLFAEIARADGIDLFHLTAQPAQDPGADPVVAALPATPAVNDGFELDLKPSFEAALGRHNGKRKKKSLRRKEKMLEEAGGYAIERLVGAEAAAAMPDLLAQKSRRLKAQGLKDVFAGPAIGGFYEAVAQAGVAGAPAGTAAERPALEVWRITAGGRALAYSVLAPFRGRATGVILSFEDGDLARASPGEVLVFRQIERLAAEGCETYDFGAGEERYKTSWADRRVPLIDSMLAIGPLGRLVATTIRLRATVKRAIRGNAAWWSRIKALRRLKARLGREAATDEE